MYKVDHVFTHGRSMNSVHKTSIFEPRVLSFNLFHNLLSERANLRRTSNSHVLVTLVPGKSKEKKILDLLQA